MEISKRLSWKGDLTPTESAAIRYKRRQGQSKDSLMKHIYGAMDGEFPLFVNDIGFDGDNPIGKIVTSFHDLGDFLEYMGEVSLTHEIMFVDCQAVYIYRSEDHQTNIDCDILNQFIKVYR